MDILLSEKAENNFYNTILPFWENLSDERNGGFYGLVDSDLKIDKLADKSGNLISGLLWFFSKAYLTYDDGDCLVYAEKAYNFMNDHLIDSEYGGIVYSVTFDGRPSDSMKYTREIAAAISALASYYDASKDFNALEIAFELLGLTDNLCSDDGGYREAFTREFTPSEIGEISGVLCDRTVDTLIHMLDACTELYRVSGDDHAADKLRDILGIFSEKVYDQEKRRLNVYFNSDMKSLLDIDFYGYDIEASWLIIRACEVLEDTELLEEHLPLCLKIAEKVYEDAFRDGSIITENESGRLDLTRKWWVQAEAVTGFLNAYKYSSDEKYLDAASQVLDFITEKVTDSRENSEWTAELDGEGNTSARCAYAGPRKTPMHEGRMCFELKSLGF